MASIGDNIYVIGGATSNDYSNILSPDIIGDGGIASWSIIGNLPKTRYWTSAVSSNNNIYVLGGTEFDGFPSYVDTVYLGHLNAGILTWSQVSSLPEARGFGAAVVAGNKIYYLGGRDKEAVPQDTIFVATIDPLDGTLSDWSYAGTLPSKLYAFGAVEYNNHIFIIGGRNAVNQDYKHVYSALPDAEGNILDWMEVNHPPEGLYRSSIIRVENKIIAVGGGNNNGYLNKVYYTTARDDGTVDDWQLSEHRLPEPVMAGAVAYANGYLYLTGGFTGTYLNSVYYAKVNPNSNVLNVPLLKQTDPAWGPDEYDTAHLWSSPVPDTVYRWGCALTSAAMVFNYHKITKLPDGSVLDPGTLNEWLKNQKDGYIGNGNVNWLALARLSKLAKSQNPDFSYDALEFSWINGQDDTVLASDIESGNPDILYVTSPHHFFVATGKNSSDFLINDPYFDRNTLSDYSDTYAGIRRFTPSNSDLSYLMVVTDQDTTVSLKDSSGNSQGESFQDVSITDPVDGQKTNGDITEFLYAKPQTGEYTVSFNHPDGDLFNAKIYLYDTDGNVTIKDFSGITYGSPDLINLSFNKDNTSSSSITVSSTYAKLLQDIQRLYALGEINKSSFNSLTAKVKEAGNLSEKNKNPAQNIMDVVVKEIQKGDGISDTASQILLPQAEYLQNNP